MAIKYLAMLSSILLLTAVHVRLHEYATDDAYTHFRVVRNLLESGQPFFNLGEPIFASSSPVWLVLLAVLFLGFGVSPLVVAVLNGCLIALVGWVAGSLLFSQSRGSMIAAVVTGGSAAALLLMSGIQLMETPLAVFLLLLSYRTLGIYPILAGVMLGLAVGVRYELAVFLPLFLSLGVGYRATFNILRTVVGIVLGLLSWMVPTMVVYGTLIPQTVHAKRVLYDLTTIDSIMLALREFIGRYPFEQMPGITLLYLAVLLVALCGAFMRRGVLGELRCSAGAPFILGGLLILGAYLVMAVFLFPWYVPLYSVPFLLGCALLAAEAPRSWRGTLVVMLMLPPLVQGGRDVVAAGTTPGLYSDFLMGAKARSYLHLGRELAGHNPEATLLTPEIGALGFNFPGKIFDASGLSDPNALRYRSARSNDGMAGAVPIEYVLSVAPTYIVTPEALGRELLDPRIAERYESRRVPILLSEDRQQGDSPPVQDSEFIVIYSMRQ